MVAIKMGTKNIMFIFVTLQLLFIFLRLLYAFNQNYLQHWHYYWYFSANVN